MLDERPTFDEASGIPLYVQVQRWLLDAIRSGRLDTGDAIPSERILTESLGLSRATVRQAVDSLEREGWVVRRQGRGTFVAPPPTKVEQPLDRVSGFSESMRNLGVEATTKVHACDLVTPSKKVIEALRLDANAIVARIVRVRLANGEPLMVERSHVNHALAPGLLEHDLSGSLYHLLTKTYRLNLAAGEERVEVVGADAWLAGVLGIDEGDAILYTERVVRTPDGTPVEFAQRSARADRCAFRVELRGSHADFTLR